MGKGDDLSHAGVYSVGIFCFAGSTPLAPFSAIVVILEMCH